MKWPIHIALPNVFGWEGLAFADRLKLLAFLSQVGAGVTMTGMAGFALYELAKLHAVWPVFYIGAGALLLVGVVVTGFGALLYKRAVEIRGPGGLVFRTQDMEGATALAQKVTEISNAQPVLSPDKQDLRGDQPRPDAGAGGAMDRQEHRD